MQKFVSESYEETVALGERLGKTLKGGEVLAMFGGMGMGKTAFTTGVAKGMGLSCEVSSPTFAIVNVYGENAALCHFDMYRVSTWADLDSTGYFDYMEQGTVLCVEWSENIENALPETAVRITFEKGDTEDTRIITFNGNEAIL
ncbi:MAG: tRNA (adenosine(37)-N6)-threonylcarbamoyltransferase complex ATPase subunit type 1 TsaE [Candidatus Fimenecus sp.]